MRTLALLCTVVVAACSSTFGVDDDAIPLTVTDGVAFQVQAEVGAGEYTLEVPFMFKNRTEKTLTMVYCANDRPLLERLDGNSWAYSNGGDDLLCLATREIGPGEEVQDIARFRWGLGSKSFRDGEMAGTYRLRWFQLWADFHDYDTESKSWGTRVPESLLVSNVFEVNES
jgi:hypothetical protein